MVLRSGWVFGAALAALVGCNAQGGMGGGGGLLPPEDSGAGGATCSSVCARQAAANCPSFNMGECASECARLSSVPACAAQSAAVLRCGASASFTCDSDGDPDTNDCQAEAQAFTLCVLSGGGDGGVDVTIGGD